MSDGPRTQQRLANDLASLVNNMQEEHAFLFLECFWETMAREWDGIDALRMDKFLLLVRRYLASSLRYLMARDWVEDEVRRYMHILMGTPLQYVFHGRIEEDELLIPSLSQPHKCQNSKWSPLPSN